MKLVQHPTNSITEALRIHHFTRWGLFICGWALCAIATFAEWSFFPGSVFVEVCGIVVLIIAFRMRPKPKQNIK